MATWQKANKAFPGCKQALIAHLVSLEGEDMKEELEEQVSDFQVSLFKAKGFPGRYTCVKAFDSSGESASEAFVYRPGRGWATEDL